MKVLLVNPPSGGVFKSVGFQLPPLSLLYLAGYLEKYSYNITVKDFCLEGRTDENFNFSEYDVVGITTDTTRYPEALKISRLARKSGCFVVMGGPHSHFLFEEILQTGFVDCIVRGEGEVVFFNLLEHLKSRSGLERVKGISFINDGTVMSTPPEEGIKDLDRLPLPARHMINMEDYHITKLGERPITPIVTSRGCPSNCSFCSSSRFFGTKWRRRSVESIIDEIEQVYYKYHFRAIAFVDDNFTTEPQRVMELAEEVLRRKLDIWWWNFSRVDTIVNNEEMVELMARAGAKTMYIGIESVNTDSLKEYRKSIDPSMAEAAVKILKKHNINIFASYIFGGLSDTAASINKTIKFSIRLNTNVAQYTILTPYPGTDVYERVKDDIFNRKHGAYDGQHLVFKHPNFSTVRLHWLLLKANILFYTRSMEAIKGLLYVLKRQKVLPSTIIKFFKQLHANS